MTAELFTVAGKLTLDDSQFNQQVSEAENSGSKLATKLSSAGKKIAITTAAVGVAAVAAAKKATDFAKQLAAAGDKIDKNSQKLGMSRKAYQQWDYILSQNGSSIDSLGTSMKTLNKKILANDESIGKLGLSYEELSKMTQEEQFETVVKAFQGMEEGAEKSALAVELFGRNGMELLPLLNNTSGSVDELKKKFEELGLELSDEQIDNAVRYTDAMDTFNRVIDSVKYTIGSALLPVMAEWAEKGAVYISDLVKAYKEGGLSGLFSKLKEDIAEFTKQLKESDNPIIKALGYAIDGVTQAIEIVVGLLTDFPGTIQKLKESDSPVLQFVGQSLETIAGVIEAIETAFNSGIDAAITKLQESDNPVLQVLGNALAIVSGVIDAIVSGFNGEIPKAVKKLQESDDPVLQTLGDALAVISGVIDAIVSGFTDRVPESVKSLEESDNPVLQIIGGALEVISGVISTIVTGFKGDIPGAIKKLQESDNPVLEALGKSLQVIADVVGTVSAGIETLIDWFNDLMGYNNKNLSNTTSSHTHINKVINVAENAAENVSTPEKAITTFSNALTNPFGTALSILTGGGKAKGDLNVPYDMVTQLHRGEMVLTKSQARKYRDGESETTNTEVIAELVNDLKETLSNLKLYVGNSEFARTVVDYSGEQMSGYISASDDRVSAGYGG